MIIFLWFLFFDASPSLESFFLNVSHYSPSKGRVCNYSRTVNSKFGCSSLGIPGALPRTHGACLDF